MRLVVGIVGEAGSGKGEVSSLLVSQGFSRYSLSDSLRKIATDLNLPHDREILINLGSSLRSIYGGDILARGAQKWAETQEGNIVIESIRNPSEISFLKENMGALVVGVTMPPEKRFELMIERDRPGDPKTWEQFQNLLMQERGVGEKETGQQLSQCLDLVDVILANEGTIQTLQMQTTELMISRGLFPEGYNPRTERK